MTLTAGTRLGPYEIVAPIGAGGMGEVYRARDTRLGRDVAIKVLPARCPQDADAAAALRAGGARGRRAQPSRTSSPSTTSATHDGAPYIVTELLEGETLRERLERGAALRRARPSTTRVQIAQGLAAAHEKGIVHRDLKPENLFLTRDGRVKILDFGLAKLTTAEPARTARPTCRRCRAGPSPATVLGTVGYMSPEQVRGEPVDHRSDIFSFGAVLYEMLTGRRAFRGDSAAETMNAILKEDPPDLSRDRTGRSRPALERIVRHCLEKNPRGAVPVGARPRVRPRGAVGRLDADRRDGVRRRARPMAQRRSPGGRRRRRGARARVRPRRHTDGNAPPISPPHVPPRDDRRRALRPRRAESSLRRSWRADRTSVSHPIGEPESRPFGLAGARSCRIVQGGDCAVAREPFPRRVHALGNARKSDDGGRLCSAGNSRRGPARRLESGRQKPRGGPRDGGEEPPRVSDREKPGTRPTAGSATRECRPTENESRSSTTPRRATTAERWLCWRGPARKRQYRRRSHPQEGWPGRRPAARSGSRRRRSGQTSRCTRPVSRVRRGP